MSVQERGALHTLRELVRDPKIQIGSTIAAFGMIGIHLRNGFSWRELFSIQFLVLLIFAVLVGSFAAMIIDAQRDD